VKASVLTLFPELIKNYCSTSILGLAQERGLCQIEAINPRDFSQDKHKKVDDTSYGGGAGMLQACQPWFDCLQGVLPEHGINGQTLSQGYLEHSPERDYEIIVTSPSGKVLTQELAQELSQKKHLIILCGRYEGFDQRIVNLASLEISLGNFVLTGGELAALSILDASLRLVPGVLGDNQSQYFETHSTIDYLQELEKLGASKKEIENLLETCGLQSKEQLRSMKLFEYPQYTKPADFRGQRLPEILESGDHKKIFLWRLEQAIKKTYNL